MINAKKKGNRAENRLAKWLYENLGGKFWRDNASGGGSRERGDIINNIDLTIECKEVKNISLKKAWQQTILASQKHHNTPTLWIHFDGMPKDKWLVVSDNYDFVELLKNARKETN